MKCPDCGTRLTDLRVDADSNVHRCFKCGGFFIDSGAVNKLSNRTMANWRRIGVDPVWFSGGKGVCPLDGTMLGRYIGEKIPQTLPVKRCVRCGKWWFPGSSLFDYKTLADSDVETFKLGAATDPREFILPIVSVLILVVGILLGRMMINTPQTNRNVVEATTFSVNFGEPGEVLIGVSSDEKVTFVEYKAEGEEEWMKAEAVWQNEVYIVRLSGLRPGTNYEIRAGGKVYEFKSFGGHTE